jgi:hypothetical protein
MSKSKHGNKEAKKVPVMTDKQKKAAKQTKKHAQDVAPLLPH